MASDEQILREADYYLNNDVTVEQASKHLKISKKTLQLHMKKLESIAPDKFKLVEDKKANNQRQGVVKGGINGKRSASWTKEDAQTIAQQMISKGMTYEETERQFGIPKSTIHEMMKKGITDEMTSSLLHGLAEANRKGLNVQEFLNVYYKEHKTLDQIGNELMEDKISNQSKK